MKVGILALQGATEPHEEKLRALGATPVEVRTPAHLSTCDAIILPGGESTTMIHLLHLNKLWEPLKAFVAEKPAWGVCAGAILLADKVHSPEQESLAALPLSVTRNAYGRQTNSFIAPLEPTEHWKAVGKNQQTIEGVFIRAPRFDEWGKDAKVLLEYQGEPVMIERGNTLVSAFHPELSKSNSIHAYFLEKCTHGRALT